MSTEQVAYDALVELVAARPGDLDFAVLCATFAAASGIEGGQGCDGCDRVMAPDLLDEFGTWSVAYDTNGDPDVAICPVCRIEAERETVPPSSEQPGWITEGGAVPEPTPSPNYEPFLTPQPVHRLTMVEWSEPTRSGGLSHRWWAPACDCGWTISHGRRHPLEAVQHYVAHVRGES